MPDIPDSLSFKKEFLSDQKGWLNPGGSMIVDPDGKIVAGPSMGEETILYAEVNRNQMTGPRWQLDISGHYARPDIFELRVHRKPTPIITTVMDYSESSIDEDE